MAEQLVVAAIPLHQVTASRAVQRIVALIAKDLVGVGNVPALVMLALFGRSQRLRMVVCPMMSCLMMARLMMARLVVARWMV
jgi:hypothetical protein